MDNYVLLFCLGVFVLFFVLLYRLFIKIQKTGSATVQRLSDLQEWFDRASKEFKTGTETPLWLNIVFLALALSGFYLGLAWFKSFPAAVLLGILWFLIPGQVRRQKIRSRQDRITGQLGTAVRVFTAEYMDTPHTVRALGIAASKTGEPLKSILQEAEKNLVAGKNADETLIRMGNKLGTSYGKIFAQLLRLSFEDQSVQPMLGRLAMRLSVQGDLIKKNRATITVDKTLALVLNILIIPVYLGIQYFLPEAGYFFTEVTLGRVIVVFCLLSMLTAVVMDRFIDRGASVE